LLVSAKEAAALLGIGRTMLYELIGRGELVPVHIGRCVRFKVRELESFVDRLVSDTNGTEQLGVSSVRRAGARDERRTRSQPARDRR
jgi:excisionase family DNA binding protein